MLGLDPLLPIDPVDWAPDLQITLDAIFGGTPMGSNKEQSIPVYACNPDLVFAGSYPVPRFACGAFTTCLKHLYTELTGKELQVKEMGKPLPVTFNFAFNLLNEWSQHLYSKSVQQVYMIGDNPAADIRGANRAGKRTP